MTNITQQQNEPENIRLLVAQARLYTEAKNLRQIRLFGAVLLAAAAPLLAVFLPVSQDVMALLGGVWAIATYFPLRGIERNKVTQAATVQEQLDTSLFELPWNKVLAGSPVRPEIIYAAERASKENQDRFRNWYSDPGRLPYPLDVLLCQRANAVWDWRLRRRYSWGIAFLTAGVLALDVAVGLILHQSLSTFLLSLFIPTLPALTQGVETALSHRESATEKEELAHRIEALWDIGLQTPQAVTRDQCRQIQDRIFCMRKDGPLIPDRWYKWLQKNYQADMDATVVELRTRAEKALANP